MGEISYRPLIEDMTFSYSRITCYDDCPYRFFLSYINKCDKSEKFYASYGTFMHWLIQQYHLGLMTKEDMLSTFLNDFSESVKGRRPSELIVTKYIQSGIDYIKNLSPLPFKTLAVEKKIRFKIGDIPMVGIVDYIGEQNGNLVIVDNKSRDLKPRSGRKKPTLKDAELDNLLRQLYIYAAAVQQEYGEFPTELCFNCFRTGAFIREPFVKDAYDETVSWVKKKVETMKEASDFYPSVDFFTCYYLCPFSDECCYWQNR